MPDTVLINPVLTPLGAEEEGRLGGLPVGARPAGWVPRWTRLRYTGFDAASQPIDRIATGFHARVVQHECDHLDGILYPCGCGISRASASPRCCFSGRFGGGGRLTAAPRTPAVAFRLASFSSSSDSIRTTSESLAEVLGR